MVDAAGTAGPFTKVATALANSTTYTDVPADPTITYDYRVTAFNEAGDSPSNVIRVEGLPAAPTGADRRRAARRRAARRLRRSRSDWTNDATNATSVVVERAVGAGAFSVLATLAPTDTTYVDRRSLPGRVQLPGQCGQRRRSVGVRRRRPP